MKKTILVITFFFIVSIVFASDWVRVPEIKNSTINYNTYNTDNHYYNTSGIWNSSGTYVYLNDTTQNVGIGTTTPSQKLVVVGDVNITGNLNISIGSAKIDMGVFVFSGFDLPTIYGTSILGSGLFVYDNIRIIGSGDTPTLTFYSNDFSKQSNIGLHSNGLILLGSTRSHAFNATDPAFENVFAGKVLFSKEIQIVADNQPISFGEEQDADIYYDGNDLIVNPQVVGSGNTIFSNGNVGIGNTSPQHKLSVQGDVYANGTIFASGINITSSFFDLTDNENSSLRFTLRNLNDGSGAASVLTAENNVGGTMSIGVGSESYMIGYMSYPNVTALISRSKGDMAFANSYYKAFFWYTNPSDDDDLNNLVEVMRLDEKGLNISKNITAENVFLPQYIFAHTNVTLPVKGSGLWTNLTFDQEITHIKQGIGHTGDDGTNTTFTINANGIYDISFNIDVIDTSASASDIDIAGRLIFINGTEIDGSVFETDLTKQQIETELSHEFLAELKAGDKIIFQFTADDADVEISTHSTFGNHPDSSSIVIKKIANIGD